MSKEALIDRAAFVRKAQPAAMPSLVIETVEAPAEFRPGLRSLELHPAAFAITIGALGWFMGSYAIAFAGGQGMPLVLAICGVCFVAYFGLAGLIAGVETGDRKPDASFAAFLRGGIDTASGHLSGGAAMWQVVTLPLVIALFGTFVAIAKGYVL